MTVATPHAVLKFLLSHCLIYDNIVLDTCGDGICDTKENCTSCFEDCKSSCGNII